MDRRSFIGWTALAAATPLLDGAPRAPAPTPGAGDGQDPDWEPLDLPDEAWRRILTDDEFEILRENETEPAGSSPLNREQRAGTFICAGCFLPLFSSDDKFMSGTGWPSFTRPIDEANIDTELDFSLVIPRTEYHCARCGGHQGHLFDDGPPPTGERWCNNGLALDFVPEGEALPELRR